LSSELPNAGMEIDPTNTRLVVESPQAMAMQTYVPEEIVENFNVMKAIYEETDTCNRWQLVTAYGTCKALADIIEFKLENLDPAFNKSWETETSKVDFSEKLTGFTSSFGYLAERTLNGEPVGKAKEDADYYLFVAGGALPNVRSGWGPFVS
jgi:hypothetical protein